MQATFKLEYIAGTLMLSFAIGAAHAAAPIRVGSILSVTGPAAFPGDPELKSLQLYVDRINAGGGVPAS